MFKKKTCVFKYKWGATLQIENPVLNKSLAVSMSLLDMVFPMKCSDVHLAYRTGCLPILVICVLNGHLNLHGSTKQLREKSLVKVNMFIS